MSNAAHTPGPWNVVAVDREYIITALDGCYDVAIVRNVGNQNNQANALLIAAAPELLAALEGINSLRPIGKEATEYAITVERIARAAIAKAKGE